MSTANPTTTDGPFDSSHSPHHRRSREEMEALAKNFTATPVEEAPAAAKPIVKIAMAAGGVVLLAVVAIVAWPTKDKEAEAARPAAQAEAARVAAEAEQWKQRFEAERERKRKELAAGKDYLERIAAADAALVGEIAERASKLTERAEAAPAPSDASVPTPREVPAKAAAAPAKPAAATSTTTTATPSPAPKTAPAQAPTTAPAQVAKAAPAEAAPAKQEAAKSSCSIHVSELSSSGKLTYDAVMRMKGVRLDEETGHVFTPPVKAAGGRTVVFEVMPDGCVRVARR